MKKGDLILCKPMHSIKHLHARYGSLIVGIVLGIDLEAELLQLVIDEGRVYWAVMGECEVLNEKR